jgi:hypothetical protein
MTFDDFLMTLKPTLAAMHELTDCRYYPKMAAGSTHLLVLAMR